MSLYSDIQRHRDLLAILIQRNLKIRYKSSALGFFWTLLGPVLLIAIYYVFLRLLKFQMPMEVLVTGIIVWQYLSMCANDSLQSIVGNVSMVKKSAFPRIILPLATVAANLVNFLLSLVVVYGFMLIFAHQPGAHHYLLPLVILTQFALCLGLALIFSSLNVYFRDIEHMVGILMMAWFFMTPVIYPLSFVTDKLGERFGDLLNVMFAVNPMTGIIAGYRYVFMAEPLPGAGILVTGFIVAWCLLFVGIGLFQKLQVRFADVM